MAKKSNVNKFQAYAMVINIFIAYFFARWGSTWRRGARKKPVAIKQINSRINQFGMRERERAKVGGWAWHKKLQQKRKKLT